MTINEAIAAVDGLRNNQIPEDIKRAMLLELEGRIYCEVINPVPRKPHHHHHDEHCCHDHDHHEHHHDEHCCHDHEHIHGFHNKNRDSEQLVVPYPYDGLYVNYLEMEIARINAEMPRYNNAAIVFNEKYAAYKRWYNRTHTRPSAGIVFPTRRY